MECDFSSPRVAEVVSLCGDSSLPHLILQSGRAHPLTLQGGAHWPDFLCLLLDLCGATRIHLFLAKPRFPRAVVRVGRKKKSIRGHRASCDCSGGRGSDSIAFQTSLQVVGIFRLRRNAGLFLPMLQCALDFQVRGASKIPSENPQTSEIDD